MQNVLGLVPGKCLIDLNVISLENGRSCLYALVLESGQLLRVGVPVVSHKSGTYPLVHDSKPLSDTSQRIYIFSPSPCVCSLLKIPQFNESKLKIIESESHRGGHSTSP